MKRITCNEEFDALMSLPVALVLKHSTACPVSTRAHQEAEAFLNAHPDLEVHKVHVIEDRGVSDYIEERTGVRHASPQLFIFRDGAVTWSDSHFAVTAQAIESQLSEL